MENKNIGLSRRKVLVGLGAVGVASAGAGLGTTAYFSDEESFEGNTITAGQFELAVTQSTHYVDQDEIGPDEVNFSAIGTEDEPAELNDGFLNITDAKPGDSYKYCWDPCVKYNPGYIQITLASEETAGNDNDVEHVDADGVLGDFMLAVVTLEDQNGDVEVVFQGTLGGLVDEFSEGGLVHAVGGDAPEYCHQPCELMEGVDGETADAVELCVYLYLPTHADVGRNVDVGGVEFGPLDAGDSPGNAVQGAIFEGDVHFAAEQCRHNDTPFRNDGDDRDGRNGDSIVDDP